MTGTTPNPSLARLPFLQRRIGGGDLHGNDAERKRRR
jgi:hypothetical protein